MKEHCHKNWPVLQVSELIQYTHVEDNVVTNPWMWYLVSLLLNANREPRLPFDAAAMDNASVSVLPYSKVPCLILKITPRCYTFCQPFVTVHSDSSLVSVVCKATPDMSLSRCIHLSSRIMQLIIPYWLLFLHPLDPEKHTEHLVCLQKQRQGTHT